MKRFAAFAFCLVFTAAFAALGAAGSWAVGSVAWHYNDSADWVKTRARLESFDGKAARYRYTVEGREREGSRLLLPPLDLLEGVPEDLAERLRASRTPDRPLFVYFDPKAPDRSVVDRNLPWIEAIMVAPFALSFVAMALSAFGALVNIARGAAPWSTPSPTSQGQANGPAFFWIFATIWSAISFTLAVVAVPELLYEGSWAALLILLFPLIGVSLYWAAFRATLEKLCQATPPRAPSQPKKPGPRKALA